MAKTDRVENETVPAIDPIVAFEVTVHNPTFTDKLLGVSFLNGRAFVDEPTSKLFKIEYPTFQIRGVTADDMVHSMASERGIPLARNANVDEILKAAQGQTA